MKKYKSGIIFILVIIFFVSLDSIFSHLPLELSHLIWYGGLVFMLVILGVLLPYFKYFFFEKYSKVYAEIISVESLVNDETKTIYLYNSSFIVNDRTHEYKFESSQIKKNGNKLQIFVNNNDESDVALVEDIYGSMVSNFCVGILLIPFVIISIVRLNK